MPHHIGEQFLILDHPEVRYQDAALSWIDKTQCGCINVSQNLERVMSYIASVRQNFTLLYVTDVYMDTFQKREEAAIASKYCESIYSALCNRDCETTGNCMYGII